MNYNVCINKDVDGFQEVHRLLPELTAKCGFYEKPSGDSNLLDNNCGRVSYTSSFIIGGNEVVRKKWPFLVALILASNGKYFCGGNLISSKHVLTAAHCMHDKNQEKRLEAEEVAALLGRHNFNNRLEQGSEQRNVTKIIPHPNWKNDTDKYDSDLALLVLDRGVQFSEFIQPVCLTKDATIMDYFDGTVVSCVRSLMD